MKNLLLRAGVLCLGILSVAALSGCSGGGGNPASVSGASGSSGGGTTGSGGATSPNSLLSGKYAFSFSGSATSTGAPIFLAGSFTADGAGNDAGAHSQLTVSGMLQSPDANGHGSASITYGTNTLTYGYDILSANRIVLIELDTTAAAVGEADLQSATFTTSSIAGNYVFFLNGISQGFGMVGQLVADGQGNISSSDSVENNFGALASGSFPGTYASAPTIQGVTVNGRFTMTATEPSLFTDNFVVVLISPNQAFVMETDSDQVTFGQLVTQTGAPFSSSSLSGNYGINFAGIDGRGVEADFVGQISSPGTSNLTAGTLDINDEDLAPPTIANSAISGASYSVASSSTGRSTMTFTTANAPFTFSFFFASPSQIFLLQIDDQVFVTIGSALTQPTIP